MSLPIDLVNQFVKATKDDTKTKTEKIVYATVESVNADGTTFVKFDGSDISTPVLTTTVIKPGERVTVMIKNHTATVTGNITSPSARAKDVPNMTNIPNDIKKLKEEFNGIKEDFSKVNEDVEVIQGHVMKVSANHMTNYGTHGIWTYEKWSNGKGECWGKYVAPSVDVSKNTRDGVYYSDPIVIDFPFQFSTVPLIFVSCGSMRMHFLRELDSSSTQLKVVVVSNTPDQTNVDVEMSFHVIGKYNVTVVNEEV